MDFAATYTKEQEQFRKEVRAWLDENVPEDMKEPINPSDFTLEQYHFWREKHREMGAKGWLYPTYPTEYGGGGLTGEHEIILAEEFHRYRVKATFTTDVILPALLVWGTEEQKQKFLAPILRGELIAWQKFTEPKSGADLASYQSRAVRDGDDWLLKGSNVFCTGNYAPAPDWIYGPMQTDPDAPRHRNLGYFMVPVPSEGLELKEQKLLIGNEQHFVFLDNVRVPGDHLIGGDHQGWQVTNTTLEQEHGGRGRALPTDDSSYRAGPVADNLVSYIQEKRQKGESPGGDPVLQQKAMAAYVDSHVHSLFQRRTFWMYQSGTEMSWEGSTTSLYNREYSLRTAPRARDVMGMYAFLGTHDPQAPQDGQQEVAQRFSIWASHGGGSLNITKVVIARRIGISRTKERAAPTPATATSQGS